MIAPVGIVGELRRAAIHRPPLVFVEQEDIDHPAGDVARDRPERDRLAAGARRLNEVARPERGAELAQRFDDQEGRREPDRPAPVRVAALELLGRLGRLVGHASPAPLERLRLV